MDKAQAIRLEACIPQNWWEFAVNYAVHVYNRTPLKRDDTYLTPFERLWRTQPDVAHLRVFGCGAYVFLPEDIRTNALSPKLELMTFIGYSEGTKGYIFMRSPNNIVFTAVKALFDETLFPKCPDMHRSGLIPLDQAIPPGNAGEYNIPPEDYENGDNGGGLLPIPHGSGYPPWPNTRPYNPPPPPVPHVPESSDEDMYMPFETPRARRVLTPPQRPAPWTRYWDSSASDDDVPRPPVTHTRPTHLIVSGGEREVPSDWSINIDEHNQMRVRDIRTGRYSCPICQGTSG